MSPDESLHAAIIMQQIRDATFKIPTGVNPASADAVRANARLWLTRPSDDFNIICARAGLEPDATRSFAIREIDAFDQTQSAGEKHRRGSVRLFLSERAA